MQIAKCEICETKVHFATYRHDWPKGWSLTGSSRWGKKYHRRSGWGWYCPKCQKLIGSEKILCAWLRLIPNHLEDAILTHLPGLMNYKVEEEVR